MRRRDDRGQATVELALVLPIVVIILAGIVWIGNVMVTQVRLLSLIHISEPTRPY